MYRQIFWGKGVGRFYFKRARYTEIHALASDQEKLSNQRAARVNDFETLRNGD